MEYIDEAKLVRLTGICLDYIGEVFCYGNRYIRKIKREKKDYVLKLFNIGLISRLVEEGLLVPTKIAEGLIFENDKDALVIEHTSIVPNILERHWTYSMFDEARKMIIKLNNILLEYGYELRDPHYDNIVFEGCCPLYLDLGSIVPQEECFFSAYDYFLKHWIYPFKLFKWKRIDKNLVLFLIKFYEGGGNGRTVLPIKILWRRINCKGKNLFKKDS